MYLKKTVSGIIAIALSCLAPVVTATSASATSTDQLQAPFPRHGKAPSSWSLLQYAPPPASQGDVNACAAWASGYTGYGILMNEQRIKGGPMAPMYVYSQLADGENVRDVFTNLFFDLEQNQGIDTKRHYHRRDTDYKDQPDQKDRDNAAHYKLSGYRNISSPTKDDVENAIWQGEPVAVDFDEQESFDKLDFQTAPNYSYRPGDMASDPSSAAHVVTIVGYTPQGVTIENSWGTGWGYYGFANLPWDFLQGTDAYIMGKINKS